MDMYLVLRIEGYKNSKLAQFSEGFFWAEWSNLGKISPISPVSEQSFDRMQPLDDSNVLYLLHQAP
jgi:hypothetical protein